MTSIEEVVRSRDSALAWYNELGKKSAALDEERKAVDAALAHEAGALDNECAGSGSFELQTSDLADQNSAALYERQAELNAIASELSAQISQARALLAETEANKVAVVLAAMSVKRDELIVEIREVLAELSAPIASLITSDIVQSRLIGEQFDYDVEQKPSLISGRVLASAFLDGIPLQLRPPNLYSGEVEDLALWFAECTDFLNPDADTRENHECGLDARQRHSAEVK